LNRSRNELPEIDFKPPEIAELGLSKSKLGSNALLAWLVLISFLHMVLVKKVYFPQLAAKITLINVLKVHKYPDLRIFLNFL
jgi:hypothetical protein